MKWLAWIVVALVLAVAVVFAIGWTLPVDHAASRSAQFRRPPEEVYALVSDFRNYPAWWPDVSAVDVVVDADNRTTFRQHTPDGPILMTVKDAVPPSKFVTFIDDESQPFGGSWTFEITPTASGGIAVDNHRARRDYNPAFRALARYVFGYTSTMESFLAAAGERLR